MSVNKTLVDKYLNTHAENIVDDILFSGCRYETSVVIPIKDELENFSNLVESAALSADFAVEKSF